MRTRQPDVPLVPHMKWGSCGGASGGILDPGSGDWIPGRTALGNYTITFTKPFAAIPIILVTPYYGGNAVMPNVTSKTANSCIVVVSAYTGGFIDSNIMFTALGLIRKDLN